jgi:hypothetical protein
VFAVDGDPSLVAKIHHRSSASRAAKLQAMLGDPPVDPTIGQDHVSIAWPVDLLFGSSGEVHGFLMPRLEAHGHPLSAAYHPAARRQHLPGFTWKYLVRTCRNLASALDALHAKGYVVGDLNESNVWVMPTAMVTIIDCDSMQVPDRSVPGRFFRNIVGKPEYTPPELQAVRFREVDRTPWTDAFALAVLIFMCLMQGHHPFSAVYRGRRTAPTVGAAIKSGRYPHGRTTRLLPPTGAPPVALLPDRTRALFERAFVTGHRSPQRRPMASEWKDELDWLESQSHVCSLNAEHVYPRHLSACPWHERLQQGLPDPFPPPPKPAGVQIPLPPIRSRTRVATVPAAKVQAAPADTTASRILRGIRDLPGPVLSITALAGLVIVFLAGAAFGGFGAPLASPAPSGDVGGGSLPRASPTSAATGLQSASTSPTPFATTTPGISPTAEPGLATSRVHATAAPGGLARMLPGTCQQSVVRFNVDLDGDGAADRAVAGICDVDSWYGPIVRLTTAPEPASSLEYFGGYPSEILVLHRGDRRVPPTLGVVSLLGASGAVSQLIVFQFNQARSALTRISMSGLDHLEWSAASFGASGESANSEVTLKVLYEDELTASCMACGDGDIYEDVFVLDIREGGGSAFFISERLVRPGEQVGSVTPSPREQSEAFLRANAPAAATDCQSIRHPEPTGALAGLKCRYEGLPYREAELNYYLFPGTWTMNAWYLERINQFGAWYSGNCYANLSGTGWWLSGQVACFYDGAWANVRATDEELLIYTGVRRKDVSLSEVMRVWEAAQPLSR